MASFIMAMTINPTAKKTSTDLSGRIDESLNVFVERGAKVQKLYATMGRYDCLAAFDAEDHKAAFKIASEITSLGTLETETWPVIPFEEFSEMIG